MTHRSPSASFMLLSAVRAVAALALAVALVAAPAHAEAPRAPLAPLTEALTGDAHSAYDRARAAYGRSEFSAARDEFARAFELSTDARLLWNMAACERKLGHAAKALALIDRYVAGLAGTLSDADRKEVARWRALLEKSVARVTLAGALPGVEVLVDDEPVGTTPLAAPIFVDAGDHRVRLVRRGFRSVTRAVHVAPEAAVTWSADLERVRVRLVAGTEPPPPPVSARPGASR